MPALHFVVSPPRGGSRSDGRRQQHSGSLASEMFNSGDCIDTATKAALLRMIERGPAFRAVVKIQS